MTEIEQRIWQALTELDRQVKGMAASGTKPNFVPLFGEIDALTGQLPASTEPQLLHYLHKKSYEKARLFLEGRDAENAAGNCRGHQ